MKRMVIGKVALCLAMFLALTVAASAASMYIYDTHADTTGNVTFQVNMKVQMLEGKFLPGSGDIVRLAGGFDNWGSSTDTLTDPDNDSIYTKTLTLPLGDIQWKYLKTLRGGADWEANQPTTSTNREYTVVGGDQTLPAVWFSNDSVYVVAPNVPVLFQVNMKVKILEGTFLPGSGDIVRIAGGIDGWGASTDTMTDRGDSVYTKTLQIQEGSAIQYKFLKTLRAGIDWEGNQPTGSGNREYTVPTGGGSIPVVYFGDDSVINTPVNANINWRVDMQTYLALNWFQPSGGDTLQVRGPFNGWGGTNLVQNPFVPTQYRAVLPYVGTTFDDVPYKMYIKLDSATGDTRFPGYAANHDGVSYEHPAERGDGNRVFNVGTGGNLSTPSFYFSSINPGGVIPAGDTVTVSVNVNMAPAMGYIIPFNPATDTVMLIWQDALWRGAQAAIQGSFPNLVMSPGAAPQAAHGRSVTTTPDSMYHVTFNVIGPTHYNMQYTIRYIQPGGSTVDQGGGLGGQNPFITRFIMPTSPNVFPRNYTAPTDVWQKGVPLPGESAPLNTVTGVLEGKTPGVPTVYRLGQNYPNPFNPTTKITYAVPERSQVTLKVYNLLGQEVVTLVNEEKDAGNHFVQFDGNKLSSGVYYYRIEAGKFSAVKKMLLMK